MQRTVIWIKPDAFSPLEERERGSELRIALPEDPQDFIEEIRRGLQAKNLELVSEHTKHCDEEIARKHYWEFADSYSEEYNENKQDFLAKYLTSGSSHWFLFEGEDAIKRWREVITDMRTKYLLNPKTARYNMTHGSWNIEEAEREEQLHFST